MTAVQELLSLTIGGFQQTGGSERNRLFSKYIKEALPDENVSDVEVISSLASLNSVAASGMIGGRKYFFKVHVETGLNADDEYRQAGLLKQAGWPVYSPIMKSENHGFPLLVYPWTDSPTLFDKLERSYKAGRSELYDKDLKLLEAMNRRIGRMELISLKEIPASAAATAPVQMFFARRFEKGARIDKWYAPETVFPLPSAGSGLALSWDVICRARWKINDQEFSATLGDIVKEARKMLAFSQEDEVWATISHGDDHAGNIFLSSDEALVFDPAAASDINPAVLADVKALAHNGFLPMGGMYYDPTLEYTYEYGEAENTIKVSVDFSKSPVFDRHMAIARQIIDFRLNPMLTALREKGADMEKEHARLKTALAACALLTVDISKLLRADDGRGKGLLAMAILLYELKGFEVLEGIGKR